METAAFSFTGYTFPQVHLDFDQLSPQERLTLDIVPSGIFDKATRRYTLRFEFTAKTETTEVVHLTCIADFLLTSQTIPEYFYANSIAIVFPYVRAFISTLSLQANIGNPIVLPTLNLSSLRDRLEQATQII